MRIDMGGVPLACRDSGIGDPMVLVHGNLGDMRSWESVERLLAADFRVINYSRRYAHPNPPADDGVRDMIAHHVDDLLALLERLGLRRVHLVGHSAGAFVCLLAAQKRPDLVRTLTLEEPPVLSLFLQGLPPKPGEMLRLLCSSPGALFALVKFGAGAIAPAIQAFQRGDDTAALDHFLRGIVGSAAYGRITPARRQQMLDNLKAHRALLLGPGLPVLTAQDAAMLGVRTQLVHGSDTLAFQRRINLRLAELMPNCVSACIPHASHFAHEDDPRAFAAAVRVFCRTAAEG
jgi:pimeloyl-ACP methyl ester carboxylesterase